MIRFIEKKPYSAPVFNEVDVKTIADLENYLGSHFTQHNIGSGLYILIKTTDDYEEPNIVIDEMAISGTVYVIRAASTKLLSVNDEDIANFKGAVRFIEFF